MAGLSAGHLFTDLNQGAVAALVPFLDRGAWNLPRGGRRPGVRGDGELLDRAAALRYLLGQRGPSRP